MTQFLGAFNDNMLRSALVVMISYAGERGIALPMNEPVILVTICSALLIFPFILFSSIAGPLADKIEKGKLITYTKIAEILIMSAAFYGFVNENIVLLMALLFVSGTHSTFFGPIKYSILPEQLPKDALLAANGFVSAGTFIGVLLGLIFGATFVDMSTQAAGIALVTVACIGFTASLCIIRTQAAKPTIPVSFNIWRGTKHILYYARKSEQVFFSIIGISWFLLVGSVYMAQFANYSSEVIQADSDVYKLFLAIFSVGIALGSISCDVLLKGQISPRFAPYALIGISVFTYGMVLFTPTPTHEGLMDIMTFISIPAHYPFLISMLCVSIAGGIYMVPLYAILQTGSKSHYRSRVIAASNLIDSVFMTTAAIICVGLLSAGASIPDLFIVLATANIGVFWYARNMVKTTSKMDM